MTPRARARRLRACPPTSSPNSKACAPKCAGSPDALEIVRAELELAKAEIARKDRIIAGLQHRLFGASSEKIDPNQLNFPFDPAAMGKPAPAAAGDDKPKRRAETTRRTKAERFPKNLKIVIDEVIVPEEVAANPDAYEKIGEEYSDELD